MSHVKKFIPDRSNYPWLWNHNHIQRHLDFCWVIGKKANITSFIHEENGLPYTTYNCITRAYTFVSFSNGICACFFLFFFSSSRVAAKKMVTHTRDERKTHKSRDGSGALLPFKDFSRHVIVIYECKVMKKLLWWSFFLAV